MGILGSNEFWQSQSQLRALKLNMLKSGPKESENYFVNLKHLTLLHSLYFKVKGCRIQLEDLPSSIEDLVLRGDRLYVDREEL